MTNELTLQKFIALCEQDRLDEIKWLSDIWKSAKKGFSGAYKSWNPDDTEEDKKLRAQGKDPYYEKFKSKALDAVDKAKQFLGSVSNLGIDPVMAATLIGVGIVGGPGAIPVAAMLYWARKKVMAPVMQAAGTVWDKGEDIIRKATGTQIKKESYLIENWHFTNNFQNYALYKLLVNEGYITVSFREWIANPDYDILSEGRVLNWLGGLVGKGVGHVAGMVTSTAKKAWSMLTNGLPELAKWAWKNKVAIAKAAYLMTIGYFIGQGVTKITNTVIDKAMTIVRGAGEQTGQIPEQQVDQLQQTVQAKTQAADIADLKGKVVVNYGSEELTKYGLPHGQVGIPPDVYAKGHDAVINYLKQNGADQSIIGAVDRALPPDSELTAGMYRTFAGQAAPSDQAPVDFTAANQSDISGMADAPARSVEPMAPRIMSDLDKINADQAERLSKMTPYEKFMQRVRDKEAAATELQPDTAKKLIGAMGGKESLAQSKYAAAERFANKYAPDDSNVSDLAQQQVQNNAQSIINTQKIAAIKSNLSRGVSAMPNTVTTGIDPATGAKLTSINRYTYVPPASNLAAQTGAARAIPLLPD